MPVVPWPDSQTVRGHSLSLPRASYLGPSENQASCTVVVQLRVFIKKKTENVFS